MPKTAGIAGKDDLTIERLLDEKRRFDVSVRFERQGDSAHERGGWTNPGTDSSRHLSYISLPLLRALATCESSLLPPLNVS